METFNLEFKNFFSGASPAAHLDNLTSMGGSGHYSVASNIDILSSPGNLTQGMGLANLTNGTQAAAVTDQINFIMDRAVADDVTYGVSSTKLHKISSTAVTNTGDFPHAITNATSGNSCIELKGKLYYFYNKASGADCGMYDLASSFTDAYFSVVPTGAAALQSAPHPVAKKEDTLVFGNGRYVGTFISSTTTLAPTKLDFGNDCEVADVIWHANQWWIAVNSGVSGTNRTESHIYLYDGSATATILDDETSVGVQRIGFLYVLNGIVYVAYQDLSFSGGYSIGYISGRQIKRLASFTGSLPTYAQKTLYKNNILFVSSGLIYSVGAIVDDLPVQISQIFDGGYATVGALSAPFGTPMVASTESTNFKLAKTSNYDVNCSWKSIVIPVIKGGKKGIIDRVTVLTNTLGSGARADLVLQYNQNSSNSGTAKQITGSGTRRFPFKNFGGQIEDFRVYLSWSNGSTTNPVQIRHIFVDGHYCEAD